MSQLAAAKFFWHISQTYFNFKLSVDNLTRFVETFDPYNHKFGEIKINRRVNIADITIQIYYQIDFIELAHKIKSVDEANSLYFEENKESTLKIIDKVIIDYNWWNEERTNELIELINHKSDKKYSNSNILQLFERFQFSFSNENISKFKLINNSFPFCENFKFGFNISNDLEIITNPILYQNGIGSLELYEDFNNILHFSDKFISNICEIKPKSVCI